MREMTDEDGLLAYAPALGVSLAVRQHNNAVLARRPGARRKHSLLMGGIKLSSAEGVRGRSQRRRACEGRGDAPVAIAADAAGQRAHPGAYPGRRDQDRAPQLSSSFSHCLHPSVRSIRRPKPPSMPQATDESLGDAAPNLQVLCTWGANCVFLFDSGVSI